MSSPYTSFAELVKPIIELWPRELQASYADFLVTLQTLSTNTIALLQPLELSEALTPATPAELNNPLYIPMQLAKAHVNLVKEVTLSLVAIYPQEIERIKAISQTYFKTLKEKYKSIAIMELLNETAHETLLEKTAAAVNNKVLEHEKEEQAEELEDAEEAAEKRQLEEEQAYYTETVEGEFEQTVGALEDVSNTVGELYDTACELADCSADVEEQVKAIDSCDDNIHRARQAVINELKTLFSQPHAETASSALPKALAAHAPMTSKGAQATSDESAAAVWRALQQKVVGEMKAKNFTDVLKPTPPAITDLVEQRGGRSRVVKALKDAQQLALPMQEQLKKQLHSGASGLSTLNKELMAARPPSNPTAASAA